MHRRYFGIIWHGENVHFQYRIEIRGRDIQIYLPIPISKLVVEGVTYMQLASDLLQTITLCFAQKF